MAKRHLNEVKNEAIIFQGSHRNSKAQFHDFP